MDLIIHPIMMHAEPQVYLEGQYPGRYGSGAVVVCSSDIDRKVSTGNFYVIEKVLGDQRLLLDGINSAYPSNAFAVDGSCFRMMMPEQERVPKLKEELRAMLKSEPPEGMRVEWHLPRVSEKVASLDCFFSDNGGPVDIALVMDSAFEYEYLLAEHLERNNLLFFRPQNTHKKLQATGKPPRLSRFLFGRPKSKKLLLFEDDAYRCSALAETVKFFSGLGYDQDHMSIFLAAGIRGTQYSDVSVLKRAGDMERFIKGLSNAHAHYSDAFAYNRHR